MSKNDPMTPAMKRAEKVLHKHGVRFAEVEAARPPRSSVAISAILRDVRKANAESEQ